MELDYRIIVSALLGVLIIAGLTIFFSNGGLSGGRTKQKPTFLIVGPSFSGKTTLFTKWSTGSIASTVTSANKNTFEHLKLPFGHDDAPAGSNYVLVDLPGSSKLSYMTTQEIDSCRDNLNGIIFMIDAAAGPKRISAAASDLYRILCQTERRNGGVNILIACNKSDVFNVTPATRISSILETEINELRDVKAKGVGEVSSNDLDDSSNSWIGLDGKFSFSQLEGQVTLFDGSVTAGRTQKWENWIEIHALNN